MTVICNVHGPMKHRPPLGWWECPGFDGEGCPVQIIYDEDLRLDTSNVPDVTVVFS